jgi:hypothetical protein
VQKSEEISENRSRKSEQSSVNEESNLFLTNFKQQTKKNVAKGKESKGKIEPKAKEENRQVLGDQPNYTEENYFVQMNMIIQKKEDKYKLSEE